MSSAFVEAAGEAGYGVNDDFTGAGQEGFGFFQLTQRDGRRESTATAFLHPALDRPNLTVETNVHVHRVLIENGRAVGVTGTRLDDTLTVTASGIILAAWAYNSPDWLDALRGRPGRAAGSGRRRRCWTSRRWGRTSRTTR